MLIKPLTYFLFLVSLIISCSDDKVQYSDIEVEQVNRLNVRDCILAKDTSIARIFSIRYISFDTIYDVGVQMGACYKLLGYGFDCTTPNGLIPILYSYDEDAICLKRGYGHHFREFVICYLSESTIKVKTFEIALAVDLAHHKVFYRDYDSLNKIIEEDYTNGGKTDYYLAKNQEVDEIIASNLTINSLELMFRNEGKASIKLNR